MRVSVTHSTVYRYDYPVYLEPHTFRLRPRTNAAQRLLAYDIQILPAPTGTAECLDQDGNVALQAWFDSPTTELNVLSRFSVEMYRENPFDFVLTGESLHLPLCYPEPLSTALTPYRNDSYIDDTLKQYAGSIAAGAQTNTLSFLTILNTQLFETCRQVIRPVGPPLPSHATLRSQEGSCRDLAVLSCDLCRAMGIAARFVSGYECAATGSEDSYMHAWAEVYLPGAGWRGYDPSHGLAVSRSHVALAAGFEHSLACPVAGVYRGGAQSHMEASLRMHIGGSDGSVS